ncbi:MAG: HEAT repeat domain-containing protein [Chloroflexota bacterium]
MNNQNGTQPNLLLTDEQMRHFIVNGFISVKTNLPQALHETIYKKANDIFSAADDVSSSHELNPLNNILPMIPELQTVLDAPEVAGGLTSLLGNNYVLHAHRHCHPNFPTEPKDEGQGLLMGIHKDGHAGGKRPRHRLPRWLILFYFPQDCPTEQGPTCVIPGNQYLRNYSKESMGNTSEIIPTLREDGTRGLPEGFYNQTLMPCSGELGTVWLLHFDIEHSVFLNYLDKARYGMKFVFMRTEEPEEPTWDNQATYWQPPQTSYVPHDQEIIHTYIWNWLRGNPDRFANNRAKDGSIDEHVAQLTADNNHQREIATNQLGLHRNPTAIPTLIKALQDEHEPVRVNSVYALAAIGEPAIKSLVDEMDAGQEAFEKERILHVSEAAYALAAIGTAAVPALEKLLSDKREHMRGAATFALGDMGPLAGHQSGAVEALIPLLDSEEHLMQRHVITALGLIKQPAERTVPALANILETGDPELAHIAAQALTRIGPNANAAVPVLTNALHGEGTYARAWASEALARIGTPDALRGLTQFVRTARWFPYVQQKTTFYSVNLSEKEVDISNPEEALPNLLTEWLKAVGVGAPDHISVKRADEDNVFALETDAGRQIFAETTAEKVNFFSYRRGEEGVGEYR